MHKLEPVDRELDLQLEADEIGFDREAAADAGLEAGIVEVPAADAPTAELIVLELPDHKDESFSGESPALFLTGEAGTGKTYLVRQHIQRDPRFGCLAATTGVAAVNLGPGVPTIHSLLGFGNTQGAEDAYNSGNMLRKIKMVADQGFRWIIIDEASMLHYKVLDYIMLALDDYNGSFPSQDYPLGLMLTGDLMQLAPVPDKLIAPGGKYITSKSGKEVNEPTPWLFKAECWERFAKNTIKLTEIRRQSDATFISALNAARRGDGKQCVEQLKLAGAKFRHLLDGKFDGTTIMATNEEVDRFNQSSLLKVDGEAFEVRSSRWCAKQYPPGEWKNIPDKAKFKVGALVMILQNDPTRDKQYVNGDLGHVVGVIRAPEAVDSDDPFGFEDDIPSSPVAPGEILAVEIELLRTNRRVFINQTVRPTYQLNEPDMDYLPAGPHKDKVRKDRVPGMTRQVWIMGEMTYFPLRLAYATTTYKSQGLSLDRVQINPKAHFFGSPQQAYVALSRCRTAEGLVIVGGEELLAKQINTDPILASWK